MKPSSRVVWLIEAGAFPRTAPRVIDALDAAGMRKVRYEDGMSEASLPPTVCASCSGARYIVDKSEVMVSCE